MTRPSANELETKTHALLLPPLLLLLVLAPATARAQSPRTPLAGEPPTIGIALPSPSIVTATDPSGLEVNPATLGFLDSWNVLFHHAQLTGRVDGGGDALLAAVPLPLVRSLVFGAGLQWLRPADAIGYAESVKLDFGLAWRYRRLLTVGLSVHRFLSNGDEALGGLVTLDAGIALHPTEWLGAAIAVRDLPTPRYDGLPLQRVYDFEAAFRPLSTSRLEVAAGVRIGERRGDVDPRFRLEGEPTPGLRLYSTVEVIPRDYYRTGSTEVDVRVGLGVGINLEQVGLIFSTILGRGFDRGATRGPLDRSEARSVYQGFGTTLRLQGTRRAPLFAVDKRVVRIDLKGRLDGARMVRLVTFVQELERRKDLVGLLFEIDGLEAGWGQVQELRGLLARLRRAGKRTYVYLRTPSAREYYAAAAADRVLLEPSGALNLKGLAMQTLFFRGLFDKIGASPQFVRIAEFKSGPEAYTEKTSTGSAHENREAFLSDLFDQLVRDLAADRHKTPAEVRRLVDQGPFVPPAAKDQGLVDAVLDSSDLPSEISRDTGAKLESVSAIRREPERWPVGPAIAVVRLEGDIVSGKSLEIPIVDARLVGDETIEKALGAARSNSSVKAIVLRIDSPGGSAVASDRIWREVVRTRRVKPVVVSMGDIAASGGYYAAAGGSPIFAPPATLTGSIGIFSGKFDLSGLMRLLGISENTSSRGKHASMDSLTRPYTEEERALVLSRLQHFYRLFLGAVASGRGKTQDEVHKVARGRVYTGSQARACGLVDRSGGLLEAIEEARALAGLGRDRPVRMLVLPEEEKGLLSWAIDLLAKSRAPAVGLPAAVLDLVDAVFPVLYRTRSGEPLTRLPYQIRFP
jgi:protease IV